MLCTVPPGDDAVVRAAAGQIFIPCYTGIMPAATILGQFARLVNYPVRQHPDLGDPPAPPERRTALSRVCERSQLAMERQLTGIAAAPGTALGPVFRIEQQSLAVERLETDDPDRQVERLTEAVAQAAREIEALKARTASATSTDEAAIFDAHGLFLQDPALIEAARGAIHAERLNAEAAWDQALARQVRRLLDVEDEYIRERSADLRDVGARVTRILLQLPEFDLGSLASPSVIIAHDLTPSDTIRIDRRMALAFCTAEGGPTSHTAILARSLGIPAVVGLGAPLLQLDPGIELAVDGDRGLLVIGPSPDTRRSFQRSRQRAARQQAADRRLAHQPAVTRDGRPIEVVANIGRVEEATAALEAGAEGVGLLRTEFLYLDRATAPSEQEQVEAYRSILESMGGRPVVVRTLDVGGDKQLPYLQLDREDNPFLGVRALRLCLAQPGLMRAQLRALLRASPGHGLHIMFPMVATLEELRAAKELVAQERRALESEGWPVEQRIPIGIMVEIPSVAVMADRFAREVDFFSIGTNDLTQYTFAAERTNPQVAHLTDACHPAILRLIRGVVEAAHRAGIWVGLCGELAGDPQAIPILLGLELDELSMGAAAIPRAKSIIRSWDFQEAAALAARALGLEDARAVRQLVAGDRSNPAA